MVSWDLQQPNLDDSQNCNQNTLVSAHYAKKLKDMEIEMKRLKSAHREHDRLVTTNKNNEKNLKNMHTEITQMKKNKVNKISLSTYK